MRKFFIYILFVLLMASMTGCASNKEDVELKSADEISNYATREFGRASVIAVENDGTDSVTYTLQDDELGFHYSITSYAAEIMMDAAHTGFYTELSYNNFEEKYQNYLLSQLDLENISNSAISSNRAGKPMLFSISCQTAEAVKPDISAIICKIEEIDTRSYFGEYCIGIYDKDECYLGSFAISSGEFTDCYEEYVEQMTYRFAGETNHNSGDLNGITYLYFERVQYKNIERLKLEWLSRKNVSADDWTTAYYFDYNNETYFMLDDSVFITDEEGIIGNHYDNNYTSYWFEKE